MTKRVWLLALLAVLLASCAKSVSTSIHEGKEFLAKGELEAAIIAFRNAVQSDTTSLEARLGLAEGLERKGDLVGAEQHYRHALALGGDKDELVPKIALLLLDRGDLAILIKDFSETQLDSSSADSELRGIVALAELALRHKDKAENQLARATEPGPAVKMARAQQALLDGRAAQAFAEIDSIFKAGNVPWWVLRATGRMNTAIGDYAGALAAMKSAYALAGWHQGVIGEYAELLIEAGRVAEAKPLLEKLRKIAPAYWRTVFIEALLQYEEGRQDEAYDRISKILAAMPEHIPSMLIASKIELDRNELSSAEQRLRKVLFSTPYSVKALRLQFVLEMKRKNLDAASAALERALRLAPNDRSLLAAFSDLLWLKGDRAKAIALLSKTANDQPPRADLYTRLAEMQFDAGKKAEAIGNIEKAIQLAGSHSALKEAVIRALVRFDMLERALGIVQQELQDRPKDPEPYLWKAVVLGSQGKEELALKEVSQALELRPDYYPALLAMAGTAKTEERLAQYRDRLQRAVNAGTKDARIYADLARQMRLRGADADTIGALLERGVAADPAAIGLRESAIRHWLAWEMKDRALTLASGGEAAFPDNSAMKALAASTHEAVGNFEQATTKYAELQARYPDRIDFGMKYVQMLTRMGKPADAVLVLRKLISQRPDEPTPYQVLAMLQAEQKQATDALVTADMLIGRPKLKSLGLLLRGDVHAYLGEDSKAIKDYEEASRHGAGEEAVLRKIDLQARTFGHDYAIKELDDWLRQHPDSIPAMTSGVRHASAKGDHATAAKYLEAIVKLSPNNPVALNDLAWAYAKLNNPAALDVAKKANALAPDNPQILDTLAETQLKAGLKKEAEATLRLAMAFAPQNPAFKLRLAELLISEGNKKEVARLVEAVSGSNLNNEMATRLANVKSNL